MGLIAACGAGAVCWLLGMAMIGGGGDAERLSDDERDNIRDIAARAKREREENERAKAAERDKASRSS